jgi:phosphatidylglycerophosphatase A
MTNPSGEFDWSSKARSRLWAKAPKNLSQVPPVALLTGTFFYSGLSPVGSGTVGSIVAAALYYFIPALQNQVVLIIACAVVLVAGIWSGNIIERALQKQDPGIVVIDEVLGQWLALFSLRFVGDLRFVLISFLLFRIFDVIKVPPARYFEHRAGGVGIMLDDAVVGIYACVLANVIMTLFFS